MRKRSKDYREELLEELRDPKEAAAYLSAALVQGDEDAFMICLKDVVDAQDIKMTHLARESNLNRESLYKALSGKTRPRIDTLLPFSRHWDFTLLLHTMNTKIQSCNPFNLNNKQ